MRISSALWRALTLCLSPPAWAVGPVSERESVTTIRNLTCFDDATRRVAVCCCCTICAPVLQTLVKKGTFCKHASLSYIPFCIFALLAVTRLG